MPPPVSRRSILGAASAGIIATAARGWTAQASRFFERNHLPSGIQLYTMGDLAQKDAQGTHASQPQPGESGGAFFTRAGKSMTARHSCLNCM